MKVHYRRQNALHKAFMVMENKINLQCNKMFHLENFMVMYGIYKSKALEKLITNLHKMHNTITWNDKFFVSKLDSWYKWYSTKDGISYYAINSLLYWKTLREKYIHMYETSSANYVHMKMQ